jgi:hypothetical protein
MWRSCFYGSPEMLTLFFSLVCSHHSILFDTAKKGKDSPGSNALVTESKLLQGNTLQGL